MWDNSSVRALMLPRREIPPRRNDSPRFYQRQLSRPTFRKAEFSRSTRVDSRDGITGQAPGFSILGCGYSYGGMLPEDTAEAQVDESLSTPTQLMCERYKPMKVSNTA